MKRIVILFTSILVGTTALAQSGYRLDVRQVFPANATVYSNTFDIRKDLDKAVAGQTAKLRGNSSNYKLQIKTPSGSETRTIQNIVWVQSVNGNRTYHKSKTSPDKDCYDEPTVWEGYSCNIDGSQKGEKVVKEYLFTVEKRKNAFGNGKNRGVLTTRDERCRYMLQERAKKAADEYYNAEHNDSTRVEVYVYSHKGGEEKEVYRKDNMKEFEAYVARVSADKERTERERINRENKLMVEQFKNELQSVKTRIDTMKTKDSLEIKTFAYCKDALKNSKISDSLFFANGLDTVYQKTVKEVLLPAIRNREDKRFVEYNVDLMTEINATSKKTLMGLMNKIEGRLNPSKEGNGK